MSSRRKRAPPVRVDEDKQQQLRWNMHEDRKNEVIILDDDDDEPIPGPSSSSIPLIILDDDSPEEEEEHKTKRRCSKSVSSLTDEEETACILPSLFVKLNVVISPYHPTNSWKAFLGELTLQLLAEEILIENFHERKFTLMTADSRDQLQISVHPECKEVEDQQKGLDEPDTVSEKSILVESSFSSEMLEDLRWLQKKRIVELYHRPEGIQTIKVLNNGGLL